MPTNRVSKQKTKASQASALRRNDLLAAILASPFLQTMPSCTACENRGITQCQVSPSDSSRCTECIRLNLSRCDVQGVTPAQLRNIASQHLKLERELEEAEEKVLRLRKQKKLWFEKMMRAIARGIDNVEELERVEREEAEQLQKATGVLPTPSEDLDPALVRSLDAEFGVESLDGTHAIDWDAFLGNGTVRAESSNS
ncbi:hypothetical protein IF2G_07722 [Cordyceps javanica]|nr:hypothetical protein IF2G_07722 [Cordyceps javanica]